MLFLNKWESVFQKHSDFQFPKGHDPGCNSCRNLFFQLTDYLVQNTMMSWWNSLVLCKTWMRWFLNLTTWFPNVKHQIQMVRILKRPCWTEYCTCPFHDDSYRSQGNNQTWTIFCQCRPIYSLRQLHAFKKAQQQIALGRIKGYWRVEYRGQWLGNIGFVCIALISDCRNWNYWRKPSANITTCLWLAWILSVQQSDNFKLSSLMTEPPFVLLQYFDMLNVMMQCWWRMLIPLFPGC